MICKNCGEQYHNLKTCPKPPNLSLMLQSFLEFCMTQCSQYNPEQKFQFDNGLIQGQMLPGFNVMDADSTSQGSKKRGYKRKTEMNMESDSDSSDGTSSSKKKRKKRKNSENNNDHVFNPYAPFMNGAFNPMSLFMNPMYGFNPNSYKKK